MKGVCLKYTQKNYGSKLQALATAITFEELGIDYQILRYNKKTLNFVLRTLPRFMNIVFLNDRYDQFQQYIEFKRHPEVLKQVEVRNKAFDNFDNAFNDKLSKNFKSYNHLRKECGSLYDGFITCSDQLWSPSALGSGFYNLMFAPENALKVSWASSFGVSKIPWYQLSRTRRFLNRIQFISMRENRGAEIVKELTDRKVPVLMDPVFVFSKEKWEEIIPYEKPNYEDYIFCYFLGSNPKHRAAARELAEKTGLKIVTLRHLDRYNANDEKFGDYAPYDVSPESFLNLLRGAKYVCTDSFHGAAFSIINEKKFVVFDRYKNSSQNSKNSRIESVCQNLGLSDRRFNENSDIFETIEKEIDYKKVKDKLLIYSNNTNEYLKNALGIK